MALQKCGAIHLLLGCCLVGTVLVGAELACKDMDGKDVDWFVALKLPNIKGFESINKHIGFGQAFYYADSNNQEFRLSEKSINDSTSAIGYTADQAVQAFKSKAKDIMYLFYNDQPPPPDGEEKKELGHRAHAKGIMAFNNKQGFWLIHSAPRFQDPQYKVYFYPDTAMKFGQSFFCGTYLTDQLEEISKQIFVSAFGIYQKNLPPEMAKKFPRLYHVLQMDASVDKKCPYWRNSAFKTKGGKWLRSYEKNKLSQSDLYANQVVADIKKSFFVETWLNGPRDWKNSCNEPFTKNIRALLHPGDGIGWKSASDHSKWAVSDKPATVCIGDINRQKSQANRGGGTLCIDNEKIWKFFRDSVKVVECCPGEKECEAMPDDSIPVPERNAQFGDATKE